MKSQRFRTYAILFMGVITVSFSSILIRWTGDVPFTVIAFYRVFISFILLLFYQAAMPGRSVHSLLKWHWPYILAGFFLTAHFVTWIAALQMTSIANAIFLESTHPLFGVLLSVFILKELPRSSTVWVLALAMSGIFIIVYADFNQSGTQLTGDILAIFSALFFSIYILIARMYRTEKDFIKYLIYIYGSAALFSMGYILIISDSMTGFPAESWMFIVLLALGPNLLGHSTLNWASRQMQIFKVNLALLLEPVLATLSGVIFLAEYPSTYFYAGALLVFIALVYLVYNEKGKPESKV